MSITVKVRKYSRHYIIGLDKIGHFFVDGYKAAKHYGFSGERATSWAEYDEKWIHGLLTSGVYSNADIQADLHGYYFYVEMYNKISEIQKKPHSIKIAATGKFRGKM